MTTNPFSSNIDVKNKNINQYLFNLYESKIKQDPSFDPYNWTNWSMKEIADAVKAVAQDFYDVDGQGYDWISAAAEAERFIACDFYSLVVSANMSQEPLMKINFMDPAYGEGFIFEMIREQKKELKGLDPLPGVVVPFPQPESKVSRRGYAALTIGPAFNALLADDRAIIEAVNQVGTFYSQKDGRAIRYAGAFLTMWKALQVGHKVRAAAVYRNIHNPQDANFPIGAVEMTYHRGGPFTEDAIKDNVSQMSVDLN